MFDKICKDISSILILISNISELYTMKVSNNYPPLLIKKSIGNKESLRFVGLYYNNRILIKYVFNLNKKFLWTYRMVIID